MNNYHILEIIAYICFSLIWIIFIGLIIYGNIWKKKKKRHITIPHNCISCKFNDKIHDRCDVRTFYAEKGMNKFCYEGELWQMK